MYISRIIGFMLSWYLLFEEISLMSIFDLAFIVMQSSQSHDLVPHDQKCELALSHARELFDFGEEHVETFRTLLREELRPSQSVRI